MKEDNSKEIQENETKVETTRSSDTRYVVQRRKPSVFLSILLVLIGAVATAVIMLICFGDKIIPSNEENNTKVEEQAPENKEEEKKEVRVLNLNPNGDFISLLYSKLMVNLGNVPEGYTDKKVTYEDLNENDRKFFVINKIKGENYVFKEVADKLDYNVNPNMTYDGIGSVTKIEFAEAENLYKRFYGNDKELDKKDINGIAYVYEWVEEDNAFYGHRYEGGGGSPYKYFKKITRCESNEECTEVYIYDKFIYTTDYDKEKSTLKNLIDNEGVEYKHTFKLDDAGNYYWYSSEKAN